MDYNGSTFRVDKRIYDVTSVKQLFPICTVTFVTYNSVTPMFGNIYRMIYR